MWTFKRILSSAAVMLALFVCVRLYRAFHNPFFKFQGLALVLSLAVAGLGELRIFLEGRFIYGLEKPFHQAIGASIGTMDAVIGLAGVLLALYALLQYRETWEQAEKVSFVKRFYDLIPSAGNNRRFWYVIIGVPLLLTVPFLTASFSSSVSDIIMLIFSCARVPAELLGLLLSLALLRIYKNNVFKYLAAVYIIPLAVMALTFFSVFLVYLNQFQVNIVYYIFNYLLYSYVVAFNSVVVAGLLVYALFTYKESVLIVQDT